MAAMSILEHLEAPFNDFFKVYRLLLERIGSAFRY
jgi:hypothetical protein